MLMKIKGIDECDIVNYKKTSMFIIFPYCSFKCEKECGERCCQNSALAQIPNIEINVDSIVQRYLSNPITSAIVCGGMEPMDSWEDLKMLVRILRIYTNDDCVIYTGYRKDEIQDKIEWLKQFPNMIIKFGRFVPNQQSHYDDILGVYLASNNQFSEKIS